MKTSQTIPDGNSKRMSCALARAWHVALMLTALSITVAQAQTITWLTNGIGNWSAGTSWVGGVPPAAANSALVSLTNAPLAIIVDVTTNIQDLTYSWGPISGTVGSETTLTNIISAGNTLSVLGPNGFWIKKSPQWKGNSALSFGGTALVVSNPAASFVLNSGQGGGNSSSKAQTMNFSGLTNLTVTVGVFGGADDRLAGQDQSYGDQSVKVTLAKTNVITAESTADYTQLDFTNSIEIARNDNSGVSSSFGQNSFYKIGFSNAVFADSIGIARSLAVGGGVTMTSLQNNQISGNNAGFAVTFGNTNTPAPTSSAYFRNTDMVSPMSLLAIGVDSGTGNTNNKNSGQLDLIGGKVDMKVSQIWLGRNRTNSTGSFDAGGFAFENGTVQAGSIIAGYMQFTNTTYGQGFVLVGTNGILQVTNYLELGYSPTNDIPGQTNYILAEGLTEGQLQVNSGGVANINTITVGALGTNNNAVTVNGLLVVSNTVASAATALNTLTIGTGGSMTLFLSAGVTNAFATNLVTSGSGPWTLNIASAPPGASTNVVIYHNDGTIHTISLGTLPPGYNSASISDDGHNVVVIVNTNSPKNLVWRGYQNSNWDNSSTNWADLSLNAPTNVTKYTDGDIVHFDDQTNIPTAINVAMAVTPSQIGNGITIITSTNSFTFSGGGSIGSVTLTKGGTQSLMINASTTLTALLTNGLFTLGASGTAVGVSVQSGATFTNAGSVSGTVTSGGTTINGGTFTVWNISSGAVATNAGAGNVNGSFSLGSNAKLYNYGGFNNIGSPTAGAGSYLYNAGWLAGTALSISGTLEDPGTGSYPAYAAFYGPPYCSICVGSLTINAGGVFIVGGANSIASTSVGEYPIGSGSPNGKVQFATGSTNIFKVDLDSGLTNSTLFSVFLGLGANQSNPLFNGSTLVITNTGVTQLSAGTSLPLFVNQYTPGGDVGNTGINTTNSFPTIIPASPGPGLAWDLSHVATDGKINIINRSSLQFSLTNSFAQLSPGTNIVNLSWPAGGFLQQQITTLAAGLGTNWTTVAGTYVTNTTHAISITNSVSVNPVDFYRFVYPAQ